MDKKSQAAARARFRQMELDALEEGQALARQRLKEKIEEYERTHGVLFPPEEVQKALDELPDIGWTHQR